VLFGAIVLPGMPPPARGAGETAPAAAPSPASPAGIDCSPRTATFEAYQHATAVVRFTCTNHGPRPARVTKVEPRGAGGWATGAPRALAPGESAVFEVHQPLANALGAASYRVGISTDDPNQRLVRVGLAGFVQSAYEPERSALDLGWVDAAVGKEVAFELISREVERVEVTGVEGLPAFVSLAAAGRAGDADQGVRLVARMAPGAPLGAFAATARISTNVPRQPRYDLAVKGNVFGDVVPSVNPLALGIVRLGQTAQGVVELRSRSARAVQVEGAELTGSDQLAVTVGACASPGPDCARLLVAGRPKEIGGAQGKLAVRLAGGATVPLDWSLWVVGADTNIKTIDVLPTPAPVPPG
jgi:hypothetical protein